MYITIADKGDTHYTRIDKTKGWKVLDKTIA